MRERLSIDLQLPRWHRPKRLLGSCAVCINGRQAALKEKPHPAQFPQRSMPPLKLQIGRRPLSEWNVPLPRSSVASTKVMQTETKNCKSADRFSAEADMIGATWFLVAFYRF